jgi:hypothetical protein
VSREAAHVVRNELQDVQIFIQLWTIMGNGSFR